MELRAHLGRAHWAHSRRDNLGRLRGILLTGRVDLPVAPQLWRCEDAARWPRLRRSVRSSFCRWASRHKLRLRGPPSRVGFSGGAGDCEHHERALRQGRLKM